MRTKSALSPNDNGNPEIAAGGRDADHVRELEQRIDILHDLDDSAFGRFTRLDWWALLIAAVLLPVIAFVAAA